MRRTTEQWEALLAGTTPGPWEVETIPEMRYYDGETWETPGHHAIYGGDEVLFAVPDESLEIGDAEYDNGMNARLAAHAPEAVAEVVRQAARIEQLDTELRAQAAQIERVREARSMINRIIAAAEGGVDLGDPVTLAKSIVNKLNDALGDTDE